MAGWGITEWLIVFVLTGVIVASLVVTGLRTQTVSTDLLPSPCPLYDQADCLSSYKRCIDASSDVISTETSCVCYGDLLVCLAEQDCFGTPLFISARTECLTLQAEGEGEGIGCGDACTVN